VMFEGSGMWDSIIFVMVMVFLIGLSGSVLFRPLLWWHRELFFGWTTMDANVGGSENQMESPNTRITNESAQVTKDGEKESPKACTHLKSCESFYTCPRAPFYRKTKGLFTSRE
jgi:hypothetical protein